MSEGAGTGAGNKTSLEVHLTAAILAGRFGGDRPRCAWSTGSATRLRGATEYITWAEAEADYHVALDPDMAARLSETAAGKIRDASNRHAG